MRRGRNSLATMASVLAVSCAIASSDVHSQYGDETPVELRNESRVSVCAVHIRPQGQYDRGPNLLPSATPLAPGAKHRIQLLPGVYHVVMADCAGHGVLDAERVSLEVPTQIVLFSDRPPASQPEDGFARIELRVVLRPEQDP